MAAALPPVTRCGRRLVRLAYGLQSLQCLLERGPLLRRPWAGVQRRPPLRNCCSCGVHRCCPSRSRGGALPPPPPNTFQLRHIVQHLAARRLPHRRKLVCSQRPPGLSTVDHLAGTGTARVEARSGDPQRIRMRGPPSLTSTPWPSRPFPLPSATAICVNDPCESRHPPRVPNSSLLAFARSASNRLGLETALTAPTARRIPPCRIRPPGRRRGDRHRSVFCLQVTCQSTVGELAVPERKKDMALPLPSNGQLIDFHAPMIFPLGPGTSCRPCRHVPPRTPPPVLLRTVTRHPRADAPRQ